MRDSNVSERLNFYMKTYKINQSSILKKIEDIEKKNNFNIKIKKNDLSQYVAGKVEPGSRKLVLLSLALNVSEAWLLGYNVPMERGSNQLEIHNQEEILLNKIRKLNSEQQKAVINIIDNMNNIPK